MTPSDQRIVSLEERRCLGYVGGTFHFWDYLGNEIFSANIFKSVHVTVCAEVVVEYLEEREGVPGVGMLETQHCVHVHGKQRPEQFTVLHQEVAEPRERLRWNKLLFVRMQEDVVKGCKCKSPSFSKYIGLNFTKTEFRLKFKFKMKYNIVSI